MAYMCKETHHECSGCGDCQKTKEATRETGVTITAKIELKVTVYGRIEEVLRSGDKLRAQEIAEELVEDTIECCGIAGDDMTVEEVEYELNE